MFAIATAEFRTNRIYPQEENTARSSFALRPSTDAMNVDIRLDLFSLDTLVFDFVLLVLVNGILSE